MSATWRRCTRTSTTRRAVTAGSSSSAAKRASARPRSSPRCAPTVPSQRPPRHRRQLPDRGGTRRADRRIPRARRPGRSRETFDRARLFRRVRTLLSAGADRAAARGRALGRRGDLRAAAIPRPPVGRPAGARSSPPTATTRSPPTTRWSLVMGDLGGAPTVDRMTVIALTSAGVRQLVDATGSAVDPDDLYRRTDGNPFFVTEILAAETRQAVPRTISDAVLARAARLSPAARQALSAAAVLARRADVRLIAEVADQSPAAIDECVDARRAGRGRRWLDLSARTRPA